MKHAFGILFGAVFAFGFVATDPANAAVDRPYQRQLELMAIFQDSRVVTKMGVIEKVEATGGGNYRISSDRCIVEVSVKKASDGPPIAGGGSLYVSIGDLQCR